MTTVDVSVRTDSLVTHGACPSCQMPVNDQGCGPGRGWIHTLTGMYRCADGGSGPCWADEAITEDEIARRIDEACAQTETVVAEQIRDEMYDDEQMEDAKSEGVADGRRELYAELDEAIQAAITGAGDDATADELREALATAWNSVAP